MAEQQSGLLSLPPEIKNSIYHYILSVDENVDGYVDFTWWPSSSYLDAGLHSVLATLQTCKTIQREAECIFYAINKLELAHFRLPDFISTVNSRRLGAIRQMSIFAIEQKKEALRVLEALQQLPQLESVHLCLGYTREYNWQALLGRLGKEGDLPLKIAVSKLLQLEKITLWAWHPHYTFVPTDPRQLEEALQKAVLCGRVTRMIQNAWRTDKIALRTTSRVAIAGPELGAWRPRNA